MAIVVIGMIDEREEALRLLKESIEVETHINTPQFAQALVKVLVLVQQEP